MFSRIEKMLNSKEIVKIQKLNILLVGVGGVGGYTLEMLVRSGVINITIIDADTIDISNLNRQIITNQSNIGAKKVDIAKERCLNINPKCDIKTIDIFLTKENINILENNHYDYIVDACDTITTKIALIKYSRDNDCKIISSMGTGNKLDPSKLEIINLKKTAYDPLAKAVRQILRKENININVMCICSKEIPRNIESRTPGSLALVPSSAGILCASYIINDCISKE